MAVASIYTDGTASYGADGTKARAALTDNTGSLAGVEAEIGGDVEPLPWLSAANRADALAFARELGLREAIVEHVRNGAVLYWRPGQPQVVIGYWPVPGTEGGVFVRGIPCRDIGAGVMDGFILPHVDGIRRELANPGGWIMPWSSLEQRALMLRWLRADKSELGDRAAPDMDALIEYAAASPYMG